MKRLNYYSILLVLAIIAIWLLTGMMLFSCSTTKRATRHFSKAYYLSQPVVANGCHELYPVTSKTEYVKGSDSIVYRQDTVINCDSVVHDTTLVNHTVVVKGKDVYHTDTMKITARDSAGMQVLYNRSDSLNKVIVQRETTIENRTKTRNVLWWVVAIESIAIIITGYLIIKRAMSLKSLI